MSLQGIKVLVPASGRTGARAAELLAEAGAEPIVAPMIAAVAPVDGHSVDLALRRIQLQRITWVVVTSAATARVLGDRLSAAHPLHVAAVGARTADALHDVGIEVDLIGVGGGEDLAQQLIGVEGVNLVRRHILVFESQQSHDDVSQLLRATGANVERVVAYRIAGVPVGHDVLEKVRQGRVDAALITSGTVARQLRIQLGSASSHLVIASLGPQTTADAERIGLQVLAEAVVPNLRALVAALAAHYSGRDGQATASTP